MSRGLLKVLVFICIVMFANSTENGKSVETKKENKAARITDIITKPAKFVKGIFDPLLNWRGILLAILMAGFYGVVYASPTQLWAKKALNFIDYGGALTKLGELWNNSRPHISEKLGSFGPTFAVLFILFSMMTFGFGQWANIFFLLLLGLFLSPIEAFQKVDKSIFNLIRVSSLPPAVSVAPLCIMLLFSLMKFQHLKEGHDMRWKQERVTIALPVQKKEAPRDNHNSVTKETPQKVQKEEEILPKGQKATLTETVPAKKFDAMKLQPKKPETEAQGTNLLAWVPIIIASVFGVGIVVGICYYKCCTKKFEVDSGLDPNNVAAMQNYETRRNTKNEFGQTF